MKKKDTKIKKMNKILTFVIIILTIIILVMGIVFMFNKKPIDKMGKTIEKINDLAISGASKDEMAKVINSDAIESSYLLTGPDCYMREKPTNEDIEQYKLQEYVDLQDKLAKKVETKIKSSFHYMLSDDTFEDNNAKVYSGVVKSFYQLEYLLDLKALQEKIFNNYKASNEVTNEDVDQYKAKVIAMNILDKKLSIYKNKNEYSGFNIYVYDDDEIKTGDSLVSYLNMLQGVNYHGETVEKLENTREERLLEYLDNAKLDNTLNL